mgnify:CR=1 FL=1
MFKSNIRELMNKKGITIRDLSSQTELSTRTVHRATQDDTIGGCQLNTLAKIADALGVKTGRRGIAPVQRLSRQVGFTETARTETKPNDRSCKWTPTKKTY